MGFDAPRVTRGPAVLVEDMVSEIEGRLAGGATPADVAKTLGLKLNTMQKAMREGRIRAPAKKFLGDAALTPSESAAAVCSSLVEEKSATERVRSLR
jgi:hypothetical protein